MRLLCAHKIELDCNDRQATYFAKACGCARKAWNWALTRWKEEYVAAKEARKTDPKAKMPSEASLRREFNAIKRQEFPYMMEVTKCAPQHSIKNLGKAFASFWKNPKKFGYPKYKKKFVDDSFEISNDKFKVEGRRILIPRLGWVRMREALRFKDAKILHAVVSRTAGRWFVSIQVELPDLRHLSAANNHGRCGVDLGVGRLAVVSDGTVVEGPKALAASLRKLRRLNKALSRKVKGSGQYRRCRMRLARLHARIANIRKDALHKLTHWLTSNFNEIVIEDLNVKGMMANRHLARCIADMGFYEFRRQLEYKAAWRGGQVIVADRYFPSSKKCRFCGQINEGLTLKDRKWTCPHCGCLIEDRDLNAAINLKNWTASSAVTAC